MGGVGTEAGDSENPIARSQISYLPAADSHPAGEFKPGGDGPAHKLFGGFVQPQADKYVGKVDAGCGDFYQYFIVLRCRSGERF